jgi:hypothetical protein
VTKYFKITEKELAALKAVSDSRAEWLAAAVMTITLKLRQIGALRR